MPVRIEYQPDTNPNAWRTDWPAVPPGQRPDRPATAGPGPGGFTNSGVGATRQTGSNKPSSAVAVDPPSVADVFDRPVDRGLVNSAGAGQTPGASCLAQPLGLGSLGQGRLEPQPVGLGQLIDLLRIFGTVAPETAVPALPLALFLLGVDGDSGTRVISAKPPEAPRRTNRSSEPVLVSPLSAPPRTAAPFEVPPAPPDLAAFFPATIEPPTLC